MQSTASIVTASGYVLRLDPDGNPIVPAVGEKVYRQPSVLGDPFAGVGLGGIVCASHSLGFIGVELEFRFWKMATGWECPGTLGLPPYSKETAHLGSFPICARCVARWREGATSQSHHALGNFELHRKTWKTFNDPLPVILQGDSRQFAGLVGELAGAISSPPYADSWHGRGAIDETKMIPRSRGDRPGKHASYRLDDYGTTPGQIGALKQGSLDAAITSPPYAESIQGPHGEQETAAESREKRKTAGGSLGRSERHGGYGVTEGQIGALKLDGGISSPPYEKSIYSKEDVLANMQRRLRAQGKTRRDTAHLRKKHSETGYAAYAETPTNIGRDSGESYWQAMRTVYDQMRLAVKLGGVCAIVVKDYIKAGKRVPLCDDTCRLLESLGFRVFERTRCWLVKECRQPDLFGGEHVERTERKSFFRRLHESKLPEDDERRIDFEEVIWART